MTKWVQLYVLPWILTVFISLWKMAMYSLSSQGSFLVWLDIDPSFETLLQYEALSSFKIYGTKICSRHKVGVALGN